MKKIVFSTCLLATAALSSAAVNPVDVSKATQFLYQENGVVYSEFWDRNAQPTPTPTPAATPDPAQALLLANYAAASNKQLYLTSLNSGDLASLFTGADAATKTSILANSSPTIAGNLFEALSSDDFHALVNGGYILPGSNAKTAFDTMQQPYRDALGNPASIADWSKFSGIGADGKGLNLAGRDFTAMANFNAAGLNVAKYMDGSYWAGMDLTGFDPTGFEIGGYWSGTGLGADFSNTTGLKGAEVAKALSIMQAIFKNVDLTGFNASTTAMDRNDFEGATGLANGAALNGARRGEWSQDQNGEWIITLHNALDGLADANLTGQNLSALDTTHVQFRGTNFTNVTGLTADMLAEADMLAAGDMGHGATKINLTGTGITKAALEAALAARGKLGNANFDLTNIIGTGF